jgi:S-adenosylmethionine:tRNA ribosyltransferase-isomerase
MRQNELVLVSDFDYPLPPELIAQQPLADRSASRLLHLDRGRDLLEDRRFLDFPDLLRHDDLLVFNNTKVLPARLYGHRSGSRAQPLSQQNSAAKDFLRGRVEVLLTRQLAPLEWEALVHPGRKLGVGERIYFGGNADETSHELAAEIIARGEFGERRLRFDPPAHRANFRGPRRRPILHAAGRNDEHATTPTIAETAMVGDPGASGTDPVDDFFAALSRLGHIPLPPYIDRPDMPGDREHYQTVYAKLPGSVAAPTAGLHFTPEILDRIRQRGLETAELTLHVGLGTFQPVREEIVEEHKLHREGFEISPDAAEQIQRARDAGRRIVAVGTTTVRTLEYAALNSPSEQDRLEWGVQRTPDARPPKIVIPSDEPVAGEESRACPELAEGDRAAERRIVTRRGEADIFIYPGFEFQVVGAMLTNFHLPKSTLLMLVSAFAGRERILRAYEHAVEQRYRFYSYGDCMFVE